MEAFNVPDPKSPVVCGTIVCPHDACCDTVAESELQDHLLSHDFDVEEGCTNSRESLPKRLPKLPATHIGRNHQLNKKSGQTAPPKMKLQGWKALFGGGGLWGKSQEKSKPAGHGQEAKGEQTTSKSRTKPEITVGSSAKHSTGLEPTPRLGVSESCMEFVSFWDQDAILKNSRNRTLGATHGKNRCLLGL